MSAPEVQKALILAAKGAPYTVSVRPVPKPGPGEVLVKIYSAALNPVDNYIQSAGLFVEAWPAVAGSDAAGVVEELGAGVVGLSKGDRVFYQCLYTADRGAFQHTVPLGLATAALGMCGTGKRGARGGAELYPPWEAGGRGKYSNQPAIIIGGASSVGQFATQLAKLSGFNPIITTCSAHSAAYCTSAGATHTIDYHSIPYSALLPAVRAITSKPVPFIYDAIASEESQRACWDILAPHGCLVVTATPVVGEPGREAEDGRRLEWVFGNVHIPVNKEVGEAMYKCLTGLLEEKAIKPNRVEVVPGGLAGVTEGLKRLAKGVSGVKLVVHPQETP
ncbi:hypothetical protein EW146_g3849 [Bondarzewia mesenterica]|uniref:Enoyl reductase (ER) domain-containing protein n=1 Tax=Bondarzewia mesenterica TaxID=1095465 RepID=A0A4S4LXL2_9AGAM|nr:hypothetical protein EW146_g3849 [Bondarzewia mesenterica]